MCQRVSASFYITEAWRLAKGHASCSSASEGRTHRKHDNLRSVHTTARKTRRSRPHDWFGLSCDCELRASATFGNAQRGNAPAGHPATGSDCVAGSACRAACAASCELATQWQDFSRFSATCLFSREETKKGCVQRSPQRKHHLFIEACSLLLLCVCSITATAWCLLVVQCALDCSCSFVVC